MQANHWLTVALSWTLSCTLSLTLSLTGSPTGSMRAYAAPSAGASGAKDAAHRRAEAERAALGVQRLEQAIEEVQARQRKLRSGSSPMEASPTRVGARAQVEATRAELDRARQAVEDRMRSDPHYRAALADVQSAAARLKAAREDPAARVTAGTLAVLSERLLAAESRANQLLQQAFARDRQVAALQGKLKQQMEQQAKLAEQDELRAGQTDAPRREQLKKSAQDLSALRLKLQEAQRKLQAARAGLR